MNALKSCQLPPSRPTQPPPQILSNCCHMLSNLNLTQSPTKFNSPKLKPYIGPIGMHALNAFYFQFKTHIIHITFLALTLAFVKPTKLQNIGHTIISCMPTTTRMPRWPRDHGMSVCVVAILNAWD